MPWWRKRCGRHSASQVEMASTASARLRSFLSTPPHTSNARVTVRTLHWSDVLRSSRESVGIIPACPPRTTQFDGHQVVGLLYGLDWMIWWRVSHNLVLSAGPHTRHVRLLVSLQSIPMAAFNPDRRAFVHDESNDRAFIWKPEWASHYREYATVEPDGKVEWDGLILNGWRPYLVRVGG